MIVALCVVHRVIHNIRGYGRFLISKVMFKTWVVYLGLAALVIICMQVRVLCIRPWPIIFGLTADGTAPMASDARWVSGSDAAFDPKQPLVDACAFDASCPIPVIAYSRSRGLLGQGRSPRYLVPAQRPPGDAPNVPHRSVTS